MATSVELSTRLLRRFKDVRNVDIEDAHEWVETALNAHGYDETDNVPTEYVTLVLLYAEAEGASRIALQTAHYFSFVDKDESIDKSMISDNYNKLAETLWGRYRRLKADGVGDIGGAKFRILKRADR